MTSETLGDVIRRLGRLSGLQGDLALKDAQLLERFARQRDESAFAALMVRHGPMVLGVCRRLLHDSQEVEDAFQAVFLVLARKAGGVQRQALVGPWLYGVAYRVAARLRGRTSRRRAKEQSGADLDALTAEDAGSSDVQAVVHEEVRRLPDAYRSAVILCCLEGKTNEEAAALLRRPVGTVKSRLNRGRELLRVRLTRRGVALGGGGLTAALAAHPATAPAALADATIRAAARFAAGDAPGGLVSARTVALTQGALRTMFLTKMKIAAVLALTAAVLGGVGGLVYRARAAQPGAAPKVVAADKPAPADAPPADKPKDEAAGQGKEKADCAWGKAVGGLQAGLAIEPAEKRTYAVGDTATFVVKVRNVTDGPVEFRQEAGDMHQRESPSVLDADGQRAPLSGPIFSGVGGRAVTTRNLAKGEELEVATPKLTWGPVAEPKVTEQTIAHVKPGAYKVSYNVYFLNPDDTMNYLTTGPAEVTVTAPDKPKDEAPKDLTAEIVAPAEVTSTDPELKGKLVLTNQGAAAVRICTLCSGNDALGGPFSFHCRPDWWKSDSPSPEASAKAVLALEPGKSYSFPFTIRGVHFQDRDTFLITALYSVSDEAFAKKLDLWRGKAEAAPLLVKVSRK